MSAAIDHIVAQSLLDSFQPATSLGAGSVLDNDHDQRVRFDAEKKKKKEAADAARAAKRELATTKAAVYKGKMVCDVATCNISLQEVEGSSANRDTKKDYSKRFSNHHKELTKMMQKSDVAAEKDDHV